MKSSDLFLTSKEMKEVTDILDLLNSKADGRRELAISGVDFFDSNGDLVGHISLDEGGEYGQYVFYLPKTSAPTNNDPVTDTLGPTT